MLVDSHCHLEYKGLVEDREGVLERARAAGVGAPRRRGGRPGRRCGLMRIRRLDWWLH